MPALLAKNSIQATSWWILWAFPQAHISGLRQATDRHKISKVQLVKKETAAAPGPKDGEQNEHCARRARKQTYRHWQMAQRPQSEAVTAEAVEEWGGHSRNEALWPDPVMRSVFEELQKAFKTAPKKRNRRNHLNRDWTEERPLRDAEEVGSVRSRRLQDAV